MAFEIEDGRFARKSGSRKKAAYLKKRQAEVLPFDNRDFVHSCVKEQTFIKDPQLAKEMVIYILIRVKETLRDPPQKIA